VLRGIFGLKKDEVTGGWRKLHNEELRNFYSSPSIIRMIKSRNMDMGRSCSSDGKKRNGYRILMRKPEGTSPRGTYTCSQRDITNTRTKHAPDTCIQLK
jgi:hypothetical protein